MSEVQSAATEAIAARVEQSNQTEATHAQQLQLLCEGHAVARNEWRHTSKEQADHIARLQQELELALVGKSQAEARSIAAEEAAREKDIALRMAQEAQEAVTQMITEEREKQRLEAAASNSEIEQLRAKMAHETAGRQAALSELEKLQIRHELDEQEREEAESRARNAEVLAAELTASAMERATQVTQRGCVVSISLLSFWQVRLLQQKIRQLEMMLADLRAGNEFRHCRSPEQQARSTGSTTRSTPRSAAAPSWGP